MPRRAANAAALVVVIAAVLVPGAAVSSYALQPACVGGIDSATLQVLVEGSSLVVMGSVSAQGATDGGSEGGYIDIAPEAFMKGNVTAGAVRFRAGLPDPCLDPARAPETGDRVIVMAPAGNTTDWPAPNHVLALESGVATTLVLGDTSSSPEAEVVETIKGLTGQYAVPAESEGEGEGIDWWKTVVPVGGAVLAIFAVSLYLMRIWHRIDPS